MGKAIKVSDSVYRRLVDIASQEGVTIGAVVERLLEGQPKREVTPEEIEGQKSVPLRRLEKLEEEVKGLKKLEGRLKDAEGRAKSLETQFQEMRKTSIGSDVRKRFECECGAKGYVAMKVECTECGREAWWGWWPRE